MRFFAKTKGNSRWDSFLKYEPTTGYLYRVRNQRVEQDPVNNIVGLSYRHKGPSDLVPYCIAVEFLGSLYPAHRVIWRMCNGPIPRGMMVDHINRDPTDNRLKNLRLVRIKPKLPPRQRQKRIVSGAQSNNSTGHLGVIYIKRTGKYLARITVNDVRYDLGQFKTAEQASAAYQEAKKRKEKA